ncbi:MAG: dihydrodipicolinate reductase [Anaerolineae bacterium]|nr:dihydrodipicolinate reductase [Anaerolineae bacterium]
MTERIRILQYGLGPIGCALARLAAQRPGLEIVGAVDIAPGLQGKDLGEVLELGRGLGVRVVADAASTLRQARPDVVLHATGSHLPAVKDQLLGIVAAGAHVVSTCEELSYPVYRYPELSRELDRAAQEKGVALLGTGVNPGFVMDKLVATLLTACTKVGRVEVGRVVDAAGRRGPLQRKVGAGMSVAEFQALADANKIGHVGLPESAHMLADVLRLPADRKLVEELKPKVADKEIRTKFVHVLPGQVAGVDQMAAVLVDGKEIIHLHLEMYVGAPQPVDRVLIEGTPRLEMAITTGVHGDVATAAVSVNCVPLMSALKPGLRTMLDVPVRITP